MTRHQLQKRKKKKMHLEGAVLQVQDVDVVVPCSDRQAVVLETHSHRQKATASQRSEVSVCSHSRVDGHGVDLWNLQTGPEGNRDMRQEVEDRQTRSRKLVLTCSSASSSTAASHSEETQRSSFNP